MAPHHTHMALLTANMARLSQTYIQNTNKKIKNKDAQTDSCFKAELGLGLWLS